MVGVQMVRLTLADHQGADCDVVMVIVMVLKLVVVVIDPYFVGRKTDCLKLMPKFHK